MEKYETEIEDEGKINIPKINIKPMKFIKNKIKNSPLIRIKTLDLFNNRNNFPSLSGGDYFQFDDKLNFTERIDKNKLCLKNEDFNSATTKFSTDTVNDKIKKVTFSTVEIIRIENYKKYNKLNTIKKNEIKNNDSLDNNCILI